MKLFLLAFSLLLLFSCRKERMTETTISGTYTLVTVKESLPAKRDKVIDYPYSGAKFIFNSANEVQCFVGADTLFGVYNFIWRDNPNSNNDGSSQRGITMQLTNFRNNRYINWQLWDFKFRRTYDYMVGHQDRSRGTYRFEFMRQ